MGDSYEDYLLSQVVTNEWEYHEICKWLPYKPETIDDIAKDMVANGYRHDRPVILYEGKILDGRHRYEAALKAHVDPIFVDLQGSRADAINYVTSENVNRRHLNNPEKEFFYVQRADALGVRKHGDRSKEISNDTSSAPTASGHADALGVSKPTIARWEKDRKEIVADPELSKLAATPEGFKKAKEVLKQRRKATKEEAARISKLKSLGESSEAEADNVKRKLDKLRDEGIDVDAVKSQGEKEKARDDYRKSRLPIEELAYKVAKYLIDTKDYRFVAALAIAAYPDEGELEHHYDTIVGKGN